MGHNKTVVQDTLLAPSIEDEKNSHGVIKGKSLEVVHNEILEK